MIKRSKQDWSKGKQVKVGFLTLTVVDGPIAIKDYMPDVYILQNTKGEYYEFIPHNGLSKMEFKNNAWVGYSARIEVK